MNKATEATKFNILSSIADNNHWICKAKSYRRSGYLEVEFGALLADDMAGHYQGNAPEGVKWGDIAQHYAEVTRKRPLKELVG